MYLIACHLVPPWGKQSYACDCEVKTAVSLVPFSLSFLTWIMQERCASFHLEEKKYMGWRENLQPRGNPTHTHKTISLSQQNLGNIPYPQHKPYAQGVLGSWPPKQLPARQTILASHMKLHACRRCLSQAQARISHHHPNKPQPCLAFQVKVLMYYFC